MMFFFEKKNQKTSIRLAPPSGERSAQRLKVFCFFSSEKKLLLACLLFWVPIPAQAQNPAGLFGSPSHYTEPTGGAVYRGICAGCHMPAGQGASGAGAYPALAQNPRLAVAAYPILRVLRGKGAMPGFAGTLSNQQIADVVAFIRQNFGNADPDPVTPDEVQSLR